MNTDKNKWTPFDPTWYQDAFDTFISTAEMLFNQNNIINQGYHIPDADGSRSSVFRNEAILNNSFNEDVLRETLREIHSNTTHKLVASNHDNVNFFKWEGHMSDMRYEDTSNICQFSIPWNMWVNQKDRDNFKLSQWYRKWIKPEDILNNWGIFKWHLMIFINQKVFSEYEIFVDEQEVILKFQHNNYWKQQNFPIFIYKFDTNYQRRVFVTKELCDNQWKWKMPCSYVGNDFHGYSKVLVAFNKISDPNIRKDGNTRGIDVLGDNLEFFDVKDGYVDFSTISKFNKAYIMSELKEKLWMSIIVPKYFHEYPGLLPTDVLYRQYQHDLKAVSVLRTTAIDPVKTNQEEDEPRQVYVDMNQSLRDSHESWLQIIRPIVLSDAYETTVEPHDILINEMREIRNVIITAADVIEEFRFYIKESTVNEDELNVWLDKVTTAMSNVKLMQDSFYQKRRVQNDSMFESVFSQQFMPLIEDIKVNEVFSVAFHPEQRYDKTFWDICSQLIGIANELIEKFYIVEIVRGIKRRHLWLDPNEKLGQVRFQRPIEGSDFWIFEYDLNDEVWRPVSFTIDRYFPDVYIIRDPDNSTPETNRVFKAFFFYADTMNVLNESRDIERATPAWDENIIEYYHQPAAVYRDVFMEKFYWMGIRSIYKGILLTECRWEVIEYVINNDSYKRFNDLFIQTMDPYFKLGLATYLKSANFEFPFDDAIAKFQESVTLDWNDYKKITNFEVYLNNQWIPSYFDYIIKIMDYWKFNDRLRNRPPLTFDMRKLKPVIIEVQGDLINSTQTFFMDLQWILNQMEIESYNLRSDRFHIMRDSIKDELLDVIEAVLERITKLDENIYSVDDINFIIHGINQHNVLIEKIQAILTEVQNDIILNNKWEIKTSTVSEINEISLTIPSDIEEIVKMSTIFNIDAFMSVVNDLNTYMDARKTNPDDNSIIGQINEFDDPWSSRVRDDRTALFISTSLLIGNYDPTRPYSNDEVNDFYNRIGSVKTNLDQLRKSIEFFWLNKVIKPDQSLIDKMDHAQSIVNSFYINFTLYYDARNKLVGKLNRMKELISFFDTVYTTAGEKTFRGLILDNIDSLITSLSYIAGALQDNVAKQSYYNIKINIDNWFLALSVEERIFKSLLDFTKVPQKLVEAMKLNQYILKMITDYMGTVNDPFKPDLRWPTYSDVYEVGNVVITNPGFKYGINDMVYVPGLGTYQVTEIDDYIVQVNDYGIITDYDISDTIGRVKSIADSTEYIRTTFRHPEMKLTSSCATISNTLGSGLVLLPTSTTRTPIINDTIIVQIIKRVESVVECITKCIKTPNPYNNTEFNIILNTTIQNITDSWKNISDTFLEYITPEILEQTSKVVNSLTKIIPSSRDFVEIRKSINIQEFNSSVELFLQDTYKYAESNDLLDESFFYQYDKLNAVHTELTSFIGTNTSWKDEIKLIEILTKIDVCLKDPIYQTMGSKIISHFNRLIQWIGSITDTIGMLPNYVQSVDNVLNNIITRIEGIDINNLRRDIWYRIYDMRPAIKGFGYYPGDIVEIEYQGERILFQITKTENGTVIEIKPMLDYALPWIIWGIHETITRTGSGHGLKMDVFSSEVSLNQSTLWKDKTSYSDFTPRFNDTDLFMFKFDNPHQLDIGYEVFLGGRQIRNHFQRREHIDGHTIDTIYVNANDVFNLQNSSIYIPEEHYFVHKIQEVELTDPGSGYCVGQTIYVNTGESALKLKVAKLLYEPYKGIEEIVTADGKVICKGYDPGGENLPVATDTLNNIDDEFHISYYDRLTKNGIKKPALLSYSQDEYEFHSKRFDKLEVGDRNATFMYPSVKMITTDPPVNNGDPDQHWYLGSRIDNSQHPMTDSRWNGIFNLIPPTDSFLPDNLRIPPNQPPKGEYQLFDRVRFHNDENIEEADLSVQTFKDLPRHHIDWPDGGVGKTVVVECDETNNGHRMIYQIRTFVAKGFYIYNWPRVADQTWNSINVNWMNIDSHPDYPTLNQQYPSAPWNTESFKQIQEEIVDGKHPSQFIPSKTNNTSYIHDLTPNDLSVFNWTTKQWEDLNDKSKWSLEVRDYPEDKDWGFKLTYLGEQMLSEPRVYNIGFDLDDKDPNGMIVSVYSDGIRIFKELSVKIISENLENMKLMAYDSKTAQKKYMIHAKHRPDESFLVTVYDVNDYRKPLQEFIAKVKRLEDGDLRITAYNEIGNIVDGIYSYDFGFYFNKTPDTQSRNSTLKRDASITIYTSIVDEVYNPSKTINVNTGRTFQIRRMLPYTQKETFIIGKDEDGITNHTMDFKLNPYIHYRNEIHLEDVKVFNRTANRFENILDTKLFEVWFKDIKNNDRGYETQTTVINSVITKAGEGFHDGPVWGWNHEHGIHIFGNITSSISDVGFITSFKVTHCPNPPEEDCTLEFQLYQTELQTSTHMGLSLVEFKTERLEVYGDGYIHNVTNPLAPIPNELKIIVKYDMNIQYEYEITIDKTAKIFSFMEPNWQVNPKFHLKGCDTQVDNLYVMTDKGRFPLRNPSTGFPSLSTQRVSDGTDVTFLNVYRRYENLEIRTTTYPMRSVYIQRKIPVHGYINLDGKLNKPLNKKYFEFWVNGRLLSDEVTIISPSKLFLHGLRSLKNLEIIEVNRDPNEYFSDVFLETRMMDDNRPSNRWNYETYLDAALEGNLEGDNYTLEEQEYLLTPVWQQVSEDNPAYKDYPPNVDVEEDILLRSYKNDELPDLGLDNSSYQFSILNAPTLEGIALTGRDMKWDQFGFVPIPDQQIVDILNTEWAEEIMNDPYLSEHVVISDDEWFGTTARLYDSMGILVHNLNESAYKIYDWNVLNINPKIAKSQIVKKETQYDLT